MWIATLAAAALLGCGDHSSGGDAVAAAQARIDKGDLAAATLQLRSALQSAPNAPVARRLMADVLMRQGAYELAVVELVKLRELAPTDQTVLPLLARAQLGVGQFKKVIDEYGQLRIGDPIVAADLTTQIAVARAMLGDALAAETLLLQALERKPGHATARLELARLYGSRNQKDKAKALVEEVLKQSPRLADAWQLKGDLLLYGDRDIDGAVAAYQQGLSIDGTVLRRHVSTVTALLMARKPVEAEKQYQVMKKAFPGHVQTAFFEAQFADLRGERKLASEMYAKLLSMSPDNGRLLMLAGANALGLGDWSRAESHLGKAVQQAPDQPEPKRLLAKAYIGTGALKKAAQILKPLLQRPDALAEDYYLAGTVELQSGKPAEAEVLFQRAAALAPNDTQVRVALAQRQLARGEVESAMSTLSRMAEADKGDAADLALIGAYLRRGDLDAALKAIDGLERKRPNQPLPHDLRARVLLAKRDLDGERRSLEKALAASPIYFPAVARLAEIDYRSGQPEKAAQRFEAVIKVDPKHVLARTALADFRARQGKALDEVVALFKEAQAADPGDKLPRLGLIDYLLAKRAPANALVAAQEAVNVIRDDADLLDALGRCQAAAGDTQQAILTFSKLAALRPEAVSPLMQLVSLYQVRGDAALVAQHLRRALELAPDDLRAQQALIRLSLKSGKAEEAIAVARAIQQQRPTSAIGYVLEGDIHQRRRNGGALRAALDRGLAKVVDKGYLATKLHGSYLAEGRAEDATRFAETWIKSHPDDAVFPFHLAMVALNAKDYELAQRWFRAVVAKQADHAIALNNLAWVTATLKQPGAAAMAARAVALMPGRAEFLDTQAVVLAQDGDLPGAIAAQRAAADLAPERAEYTLKLGRLYLRAGDAKAARDAMARLTDVASRNEAQQMLKGL